MDDVLMADTLINGKTYKIWGGLVDNKKRFIGGIVRERDKQCGETEGMIQDIRLEPNGKESAMFVIDIGKGMYFSMDVHYTGIRSINGNLEISTHFGTSYELIPAKEKL